jgi:hypothetical protein
VVKAADLNLETVKDLIHAEVLCGEDLTPVVSEVGAADLMSDVLALSKPGMLLLTGLVSTQVIRTAVVVDLCGVVFVRGKKPGHAVLELARELGVPVLGTPLTMFETAGLLYAAMTGR